MAGNPSGAKACILAHRDELTVQNRTKFGRVAPEITTSVVDAEAKSWAGRATFAMVPTLTRPANLAAMPALDLLVIDEAHHAAADSYRRIIDHVRGANPACRIFGVTATPNRGDRKGLREIFDNVGDQVRLGELIASGHLVPPRTFIIDVGVQEQLRAVLKSAADYDTTEVAQIMNRAPVTDELVRHWQEKASARPTVVFCSTVAHAENVAAAFNGAGVSAAVIDGDLDAGTRRRILAAYGAEMSRITVDTTRIASESFPMAIPPEEAERRCRRALMEAWIGRESATFRLPPSRLALDPADVIRLVHDGRDIELRLVSIADSGGRGIEAVRQDRAAYDLPPGDPRPATLTRSVVFGAPDVVLLDLPQLSEDQPAHRPMVAAHAVPWPGEMAVFRSPGADGFALLTTFGSRARIGTLVSDFHAGPTSRFDLGNALVVDLASGTVESVTDLTLFGGANALALESAQGKWEVVQAGAAELIAPGRYRLSRLLRGQRGTEAAMGNPAPAGARVVVLDSALAPLPIAEADLGLPWNWRIGPAARAVSDASYTALAFMPSGRGLVPFAPVHVVQPWRTARSPGDLTIRWTRRSRALVADAWEQVEVPLAEDLESYDIQILDGAVVKRTLTSSTTSVLYTAPQQTADWGALLGPGQTLAIRIYQLSNRLGRGDPATVTLQF